MNKMDANDPYVEWHKAAFKGIVADQQRGVIKGHRGWSDNIAVLNEDLPFPAKELSSLTAAGKAIVISSAPDDETNPPAMQEWWVRQIQGARIIHREPGYGHAHAVNPACVEAVFQGMRGEVNNTFS